MLYKEPSWTLGIEEEYLLVDPETRDLASSPPGELWDECIAHLADLVRPEFLKSQIEVGTPVCANIKEANTQIKRLRRTVAEAAQKNGLAIIAASTHPFAQWTAQAHTDKDRYNVLAEQMQAVARRLLICGMHVHVGIDNDDLRIDLLNQVAYFLPHLLALSTSSPFWRGQLTGLKSYRLAVFDELPRTGLPEQFDSFAEYQRHVDVMVHAGLIPDATMLWWDVRPSVKFPTLEMRISDVCSRIDDAVTIAALYVCVLRMLYRLRRNNQRWRRYAAMLINENRWRAQRYGINGSLVDFGRGLLVENQELLEELIELTREDAQDLDCVEEIARVREIAQRGTSAHWQIATYQQAMDAGASTEQALQAVVDMLITESASGLD